MEWWATTSASSDHGPKRKKHRRGSAELEAAVHVRLHLGGGQRPVVDADLVDQAAPALEAARAPGLAEDERLRVGTGAVVSLWVGTAVPLR